MIQKMSQRKKNGRMPLEPTMCELRMFVPKRLHDILRMTASDMGIPVSSLVARMVALGIDELHKERPSDAKPTRELESATHNGPYPDAGGPTGSPDASGENHQSSGIKTHVL